MTDNEIIKALECCFSDKFGKCEECPLRKHLDEVFSCMRLKQKLALDLINRQKAEKEALIAGQETLQKYIADQKAEIDRLEVELKAMRGAANSYKAEISRLTVLAELGNMRANDYRAMRDKCKTAKAEGIKEFAERFKKRIAWRYTALLCKQLNEIMDNLVKEMVGDYGLSEKM